MAGDMKEMKTVELGDLSFVSTETPQDDMYGQMENNEPTGINQKSSSEFGVEGLTSNILNKRGFGWLLEVEEVDDEAFDKPLLYGF